MKIALPITEALLASNLRSAIQERHSQKPFKASPSHHGTWSLESHQSFLFADPLNIYHTTVIYVGTPPQPFTAVIDISSSDLVIPALGQQRCRDPQPAPVHSYVSSISSTYSPNGTLVTSNNGGVVTSGFLSQDDVHISHLRIKNLLFEEATLMDLHDCFVCGAEFDTFLPLGPYNASSPRNFMSPIARLISEDLLDENIFSLRLSRGLGDGLGQLVLGGVVDEELYDGDMAIIPVTDHPSFLDGLTRVWKAEIHTLALGDGSQISADFKSPYVATFFTQFPFIGLPQSLADSLNAFMESEDSWFYSFVDCSKRGSWPNVTIVLAGHPFELTPYDYVIEQDENGKISCMSAFIPLPDYMDDIYLGSAFLKAFVTVWDLEARTIGFARAKHGPPRGE